ncbi:zinc ribbon domain-containing protein [Xanthobacter sp. DSM 24535]|uniref:hypothetical protein n=1 Tax=Roseixanthobacter psychrophilus TaxID=3119917 RepID=UPI00372968F5
MSRQPDACPGCGAPTHPHAIECAECGTVLPHRQSMLPLIVGVCGILVAILAGAGVWILLSPTHEEPAQQAAVAPSAAPAMPAPPAPTGAPQPTSSDLMPPVSSGLVAPSLTPPAAPPPSDAPAELPTLRPGVAVPAVDEPTRRAFAKTTQDNFVQNGLDLQVTTTGPEATIIAIKFNFPAKTAVELIASGPFPRQCKQRGFKTIQFSDPNAISWTYDVETDKLTQK